MRAHLTVSALDSPSKFVETLIEFNRNRGLIQQPQIIRGRKTAGWTQAELAARAGVPQETISRIESGKHSPGL